MLLTLGSWLTQAEARLNRIRDSDANIVAMFRPICKQALACLVSKIAAEVVKRASRNEVWVGLCVTVACGQLRPPS